MNMEKNSTNCTFNSNKFKNLADDVKMSYDHFIRTTDIQHIKFVQTAIEAIQKSEKSSDIYLGSYEGYYMNLFQNHHIISNCLHIMIL